MTKLGFIGLGLIGTRRAKIAKDHGCEIVFAVDPNLARHDVIESISCVKVASLEELEMRGTDRADAVLIAVPHDLSREYCQWAFARGAHVLCEKPMGVSIADAEIIANAASAARKVFCAGFNYRYLSGIVALREIVRAGKLGKLLRVRLAMGHGGRPGMEAEWKLKLAHAGGGALIDPGIHLVDLCLHLFGSVKIEHVDLHRRFWKSDVEDECVLTLYGIDARARITIEVNLTSWQNQFTIEAYGDKGQAVLTGRGGNYGPQRLEYTNRWFWQPDNDHCFTANLGTEDLSFERETLAFLDLIAKGIDDGILSRANDGCAAISMISEAYATIGAIKGLD